MPLLFPPPENNFQPPPLPEEENLIEVVEIVPEVVPEVVPEPVQEHPIQLVEIVPNLEPIVDEGHPNISETDSVPSSSTNLRHIIFLAQHLKRLDTAEYSQRTKVNCLCLLAVLLTLSQAAIITLILLIILHYI